MKPASATTGAAATISPSQGRRGTVRAVLAIVQASSADMATTVTAKKVTASPSSRRVSPAAR
jgi:hypothetical protein